MTDKITDWRTLNLQSLDILLCSGNGSMSRKIQWLQRLRGFKRPAADTSHAATIVTMDDFSAFTLSVPADPLGLYVSETTTLNSWTVPPKKGLQINSFDEWLKNYNGKVWIRQVQFGRTENFNRELIRYIFTHLRDPKAQKYESGIPGLFELLLCELGIKKAILETAELHCTEWVSELLREFKILANVYSGNRLPPCEWWPHIRRRQHADDKRSLIDMQALVKIDEPIRIK